MYKNLTYQTGRLALTLLILSLLFASSALAATPAPLKVNIASKSGSYKPGDILKLSWTPATTIVQDIGLVSTNKSDETTYYINSELISGDPVITGGSFTYKINDFFIPTGSYNIILKLPGEPAIAAKSAKTVKIENRPSVYFGTANGEVNSLAISAGKSITLKWDAESVKKCKASSYPTNSKWNKNVRSSGTKKIRITRPTTFYLTCKNSLGEVTTALTVDTEAPAKSVAKLIPSTNFITTNYRLGTTQEEAMSSMQSIILFNSSEVLPIYYKILTVDQPKWINTGYTTSQISLPPLGTAGIGAFTDPSNISAPGTYTWNLKLEGNFSNSPLVIPITMNVLP